MIKTLRFRQQHTLKSANNVLKKTLMSEQIPELYSIGMT